MLQDVHDMYQYQLAWHILAVFSSGASSSAANLSALHS